MINISIHFHLIGVFFATISVQCVKFANVGYCYYYEGNLFNSNLTLGCVENLRDSNLLTPYEKSKCRNSFLCEGEYLSCKDGFYKFKVGSLRFENCEFDEFPAQTFQAYRNTHTINMSDLGLQRLSVDSFIEATNLQKFIASHNQIEIVTKHLFHRSVRLADVDLSSNKIYHFDVDVFPAQNALATLNLSSNNITSLSVDIFQKLNQLAQLRLSHNQIEEIPSFVFHKTEKLVEIDFSFNAIRRIDDFAFAGDFNLTTLNLAHNYITGLNREIFDNHINLKHLDISSNQMTVLHGDIFKTLTNLTHLDLSNNPLNTLPNALFENLVKLETLNLSRTMLIEIGCGMFAQLTELKILDLSNNLLKTIDANIFPTSLTNLASLSIANNQLKELNGFTTERLLNTKIIGIDRNQFSCSYFKALFKAITWKHLDMISTRINCSSVENVTKSSQSESNRGVKGDVIHQSVLSNNDAFVNTTSRQVELTSSDSRTVTETSTDWSNNLSSSSNMTISTNLTTSKNSTNSTYRTTPREYLKESPQAHENMGNIDLSINHSEQSDNSLKIHKLSAHQQHEHTNQIVNTGKRTKTTDTKSDLHLYNILFIFVCVIAIGMSAIVFAVLTSPIWRLDRKNKADIPITAISKETTETTNSIKNPSYDVVKYRV